MKIFTKIKEKIRIRKQEKYDNYIRKLLKKGNYNAKDLALLNYNACYWLGITTIIVAIDSLLILILGIMVNVK